jgi:hypothetical protein
MSVQTMTPTRRLYYYGPQRAAVEHHLQGLCVGTGLPARLVGVNMPEHLYGLRDVCFVEIAGHPKPVPVDMRQMLLERGCVTWSIDDSALRHKYDARVMAAANHA